MNKVTVGKLFKRAFEQRRSEIRTSKYAASREISDRADVAELEAQISKLKAKRDKIVDAYVGPRVAKSDAAVKELEKRYNDLNNKLGFAITNEEKAAAVQAIKAFLKSLPNCPEAKLL